MKGIIDILTLTGSKKFDITVNGQLQIMEFSVNCEPVDFISFDKKLVLNIGTQVKLELQSPLNYDTSLENYHPDICSRVLEHV